MSFRARLPRVFGIALSLGWTITLDPTALAQLRIVTYNTATAAPATGALTARTGTATVLEAIGAERVGGVAKPIDVLLLQEQFSMATSTQSFVELLNDLYDPIDRTMYARSTRNGFASADFIPAPDTGAGGRPGLVYNTQTVDLIDEIAFGNANGSQQARQTLRYQLRPVGYDSTSDLYIYNNHYKAGSTLSDQTRRLIEAQAVRDNADALGPGAHILYAGDFNIRSSGEAMYGELLAAGNGQAFDPIETPGIWHNNGSLQFAHTQSTATASQFTGQALGGVDDRFDFQLTSGELTDGEGLSYLAGSYHAFGNNGSHGCCNRPITAGNGAAPGVLAALTTASDHLPVVADYQVPAILSAELAAIPTAAARGATVHADVLVENVADVVSARGADELDYTITVNGDLLGGASGIGVALGGANAHRITLDTSVEGLRSGVVSVVTTSQGAANRIINIPVQFTVGPVSQVPFQVRDDFDLPVGLQQFVQSPAPGAFSSAQDGFERYQVGVSSSIPSGLVDASTVGSPNDNLGIVNGAIKTDGWFGITDLANSDNPSGQGTATWEFDISGASSLEVSIDMAAMGDFEDSVGNRDIFDWTYSIDDGPALALFTSAVDEGGSASYRLAGGQELVLNDPLQMVNSEGRQVQLSNSFQTLTSRLAGVGETLTIGLFAQTDGGSEVFALDNLVVDGVTISAADADFNQDGDLDGSDLLAWQRGFGVGTSLAEGDANGDRLVDQFDLAVWESQWGGWPLGRQQATVTVPEPASLGLAFGVLLLRWRRLRVGWS